MLAAIICVLVILTLSSVAVEQSVGSLSGFAQGRKLLQTVDAAEAGIQSEISALQIWLASPAGSLPCAGVPDGQGWVAASASSADSVVNAASLGYYKLSLATYAYTSPPPSLPLAELPSLAACYNNPIGPGSGTSWYVVVQSKGVTSAATGGSTSTGRTLQALLLVQDYAASTSSSPGVYTSKASAEVFNVNTVVTPPSTAPSSPTASTASYSGPSGSGSNTSSAQPSAGLLNGESWLTAGALSQYAEADYSGSSSSCAGLLASPGAFQVGSPTCSTTGSPGGTGVTLDLSAIPAVGSTLSSIADVTLETSAISCSASMGTGGSPQTGAASFGTVYVRVKTLLGSPVTIPVNVSSSPNQDLVGAVTSAISADSSVIGPVTSTLVSALDSTVALTSNYQTTVGGVLTVSAVHISMLGNSATGDLALCSVGPNTAPNSLKIIWIRQVP